ncbi:unnamed protein product [Arabidopsis halleri]
MVFDPSLLSSIFIRLISLYSRFIVCFFFSEEHNRTKNQ